MIKQISVKKQETYTGIIFITPFLIGLTVFVIIPILYTFYLAFMDFNNLGGFIKMQFLGLQNLVDVISDKDALSSYAKSGIYSLFYVPAMICFSLIMALLMNTKFKFRIFSRTLIFMPYVSNIMAVAIVWNLLLNPFGGPVNDFLSKIGVANPPGWLSDPSMALPVTALIATWQNLAFQTIVFLAALQDVPEELIESVNLEGANKWVKFTKIIMPFISPTTFFLIVTTIIGSTQNFSNVYTLTSGGPGGATDVSAISIYKSAFQFSRYSFASAQTIILFSVLLVITIIQWRGQKKWVNY